MKVKDNAPLAEAHQSQVDAEVERLKRDIVRLGERNDSGQYEVLFGVLFDDEEAQQNYEAIVGTIKAAKKKGVVAAKGQMWLKGMHDEVPITLLDADEAGGSGGGSGGGSTASPNSPTSPKVRQLPGETEQVRSLRDRWQSTTKTYTPNTATNSAPSFNANLTPTQSPYSQAAKARRLSGAGRVGAPGAGMPMAGAGAGDLAAAAARMVLVRRNSRG